MFRAQIRGSLLDALERMAQQSGREPNELLDELLVQATSTDVAPTPAAAPTPTSATAPTPATRTGQPETSNPRQIGETMAARKRREVGQDPAKKEVEEEDEAPRMTGDRPNPLKAWAGTSAKDDPATKESKEVRERARLRAKYHPNRGTR